MVLKMCADCRRDLEVDEFSTSGTTQDGTPRWHSYCTACLSKRRAAWASTAAERLRKRERYAANRLNFRDYDRMSKAISRGDDLAPVAGRRPGTKVNTWGGGRLPVGPFKLWLRTYCDTFSLDRKDAAIRLRMEERRIWGVLHNEAPTISLDIVDTAITNAVVISIEGRPICTVDDLYPPVDEVQAVAA